MTGWPGESKGSEGNLGSWQRKQRKEADVDIPNTVSWNQLNSVQVELEPTRTLKC